MPKQKSNRSRNKLPIPHELLNHSKCKQKTYIKSKVKVNKPMHKLTKGIRCKNCNIWKDSPAKLRLHQPGCDFNKNVKYALADGLGTKAVTCTHCRTVYTNNRNFVRHLNERYRCPNNGKKSPDARPKLPHVSEDRNGIWCLLQDGPYLTINIADLEFPEAFNKIITSRSSGQVQTVPPIEATPKIVATSGQHKDISQTSCSSRNLSADTKPNKMRLREKKIYSENNAEGMKCSSLQLPPEPSVSGEEMIGKKFNFSQLKVQWAGIFLIFSDSFISFHLQQLNQIKVMMGS